MQKIEAQFEIVTPMFIGSGVKDDPPEIRPPSIKGALRFWWRALHWGHYLKQAGNNTDTALQNLHAQEAELFGAAFRDNQYGQGLCTVKLKQVKTKGVEANWPSNNDAGAGFLGYGLDVTKSGEPHRKAINEGEFTVCLMLKKAITAIQIEQLQNTLIIWGLIGGLGSRSRRGFGSVAIKQLNEQSFIFNTVDAYHKHLRSFLDKQVLAPEMPIFTALNEAMQISEAGQGSDFKIVMNKLGSQYKEARKEAGAGLKKLPFGLPLAGNRDASDEKNRRSSPLLMHLHKVNQHYVAMVSFIPANFHPEYPEGNKIEFYDTLKPYMETMERVYP